MARQGYDLQLARYDEKGWRATFYTTGMEHSPTGAIGTGWERTPWHAVQGAAWGRCDRLKRATDDGSARRTHCSRSTTCLCRDPFRDPLRDLLSGPSRDHHRDHRRDPSNPPIRVPTHAPIEAPPGDSTAASVREARGSTSLARTGGAEARTGSSATEGSYGPSRGASRGPDDVPGPRSSPWGGASFERRRRLGAPRVARPDPGLTSRLSRVASDTTRCRRLHTCAKSSVLCTRGIPKAGYSRHPGTNHFGKLAARSLERWLLVARGCIPVRRALTAVSASA